VKETFAALAAEQVLAAYRLQARAETCGVAAPRQLLTVAGLPAVYADGEMLRLFDWVALAGPDRDLDAAAVGRMIANLHRAAELSDSVVHPWYVEPVGRDHWIELVAELRLAGAPFADDLEALVEELAASESIMEPPRHVISCHRDLWADNVRRGPGDGPVVIDWDNCGPASAPGELAMVLAEFGTTPARARDLYAAYVDTGGPARITGLGDFTMPTAVLHHLVELGARQWLAAAGELARQRAAARVREFLDDPFRLADAERLLAAAGSARADRV
jgi:Ser/Thr protein kinase RdoA (MazF antagonist)